MFEENEEITRLSDAVYEAFRRLRRGDVLTNDAIEATIGIPPNIGRWQHVVNKARRRLIDERNIATRWERAVGCKLLTVAEQLDSSVYRRQRARRQLSRGIREVKALPAGSLSLHQRLQQSARVESLARERRELSARIREDAAVFRRTQTLPRAPLRKAE